MGRGPMAALPLPDRVLMGRGPMAALPLPDRVLMGRGPMAACRGDTLLPCEQSECPTGREASVF
ncbi:hypothetical protein DSO57_1032325 [Entomophthora muscae]|uniref:Uncharacterized protein n=1 Tax=Entomophthora muscae TaxID=34485 RepID=A0ACC2TMC0_9FUNG|nr:hypothetical protein DSO57_1032325 [Entomophthora muscae]